MNIETFPAIMAALRESEAGESLKETYRWSTFRATETDREWRDIFGATASDLSHGQLMYGVAKSFLERERGRFTSGEEEVFLYGILCHDWGEAIIDGEGVGDVYARVKTEQQEKTEAEIAHQVIETLNLDDEEKRRLHRGYEQVVEGGNPLLQTAFKALEKTEYVMTAIKVYQNNRRLEGEDKVGMVWEEPMVGRVVVLDLARVLREFAPRYPDSIGAYFRNMAPVIEEMFAYTLPWLNTSTSWQEKAFDHRQLALDFAELWEKFKNQEIRIAPERLVEILPLICDERTSNDPQGWSKDNPLWGHCAVVSLLAQDLYGGRLLRASLGGTAYEDSRSHYLNGLSWGEQDFTKEQFTKGYPEGLVLGERTREYVLSNPETARRYALLRERLLHHLKKEEWV